MGEANVTDFAAVDPNLTVEAEVKLAPVIVTVLPPVVGPAFGDRPVTAAGAATVVEVMPDPQPLFDPPLLVSPA
ncbi:MAG TPA: hypothetical protein VGL78_00565 [Solirubrobacteraceae bacterium]